MQQEHLLQKASSGFKEALHATFWQSRILACSSSLFSRGTWFRSVNCRDGGPIFLFLLCPIWAGEKAGELSVSLLFEFWETNFRRCPIIWDFVYPVYFLSFPISAQMISRSSGRVKDWSISGASFGHWAISWTSSLFSPKLSRLHFSGSSIQPSKKKKKI